MARKDLSEKTLVQRQREGATQTSREKSILAKEQPSELRSAGCVQGKARRPTQMRREKARSHGVS